MVSTSSQTIAVIDIGSNTSLVTVFRTNGDGYLETLADSRAALQLLRGLTSSGREAAKAAASLLAALRDFQVLARAAGAEQTVALATYSVRGYSRAKELVHRIEKETGIKVKIIDGHQEAELAFLGAIYATDVDDGMVVDLGGGSVELARFRRRTLVQTWSLPLGALLLSDRYLLGDPPSKPQIRSVQDCVRETLAQAKVSPLDRQDALIVTGGTVRNLARIDRQQRRYGIQQLQGYVLRLDRLRSLRDGLAHRTRDELRNLRGLNSDRKDSIVGGAVALTAILQLLGAKEAVVSGQGLREGFALSTRMSQPPPAHSVRSAAVKSLASRFATWEEPAAVRRAALAASLQAALDPTAGRELQECLLHAAWIVDIGRSVDFARRFEAASLFLANTVLAGFGHRKLALLSGILGSAEGKRCNWRLHRPLLRAKDEQSLTRSGLILALADEVEKRLPREGGIPVAYHDSRQATVGFYFPTPSGGRLATIAERFPEVFGWKLRFEEKG